MEQHWKVEVLTDEMGAPRQTTVIVYERGEQVKVTTKSVEPFESWREVMQELIDSLPIQLRLL